MKKIQLFALLLISLNAFSQVSPILPCRVANWVTAFGQNLSIGSEVYVVSDSTKWIAKAPVVSSATITTAYSSFIPQVERITGTAPVTSSGLSKVTIGVSPVTTYSDGIMTYADKIKLNGIAAGATANTGTVSSVAMTTPIGLTVTGSPITLSGTLALSLTSGYAIPTTANITTWNSLTSFPGFGTSHVLAAYGDHTHAGYEPALGNPSVNGYVLASTTAGVRSWVLAGGSPNNGTLTLATSGIGLSGSQTFTANQATGATFTVTSNATSASAGNTLMSRDASASVYANIFYGSNFQLSDIRLKRNIRDFNDTDFWKAGQIQFHKYTYISDAEDKTRFGVIAQEIEQLFPELVNKDADGIKSVSYIDLYAIILAKQAEEIEMLKERIKVLENEK